MRVHILLGISSMTGADTVLSLWSLIAPWLLQNYPISHRWGVSVNRLILCLLLALSPAGAALLEGYRTWKRWSLAGGSESLGLAFNIHSMGSLPGCTCSVTVALHSCCHHDGLCPFKLQTKTKHSSLKLLLVKNLLGHSNEKSRIVF